MPTIPSSRRGALSALSVAGLAATAIAAPAQAATRKLNLDDPWDNLTGYLKARSDISGKTSVSWTSGYVYNFQPGRKSQVLMLGQGVKCTACVKDDKGYEFLERECVIFCDPATGEPLKTWANPFTEKTVEVFHIQNASAGGHIDANGAKGPFHMSYMENTGDVTFHDDLFYSSPSRLSVKEYSTYAASDTYEGAGIYHFHAKRADLDNADLTSAPVTTSHTGVRQWLPWMEMGQWPGGVVLPSRGKKLPNGVADIPKQLRAWMEKNSPEFLQAPTMADKDKQRFFYEQFKDHVDKKRKGVG
ncbi:MAG: DUF1838 domain-containing protein [Rhodospirillaceae bacterium]|nr:DUF1838 domain-containing protein [Rhodospirillaceae bacterium]